MMHLPLKNNSLCLFTNIIALWACNESGSTPTSRYLSGVPYKPPLDTKHIKKIGDSRFKRVWREVEILDPCWWECSVVEPS